MREVNLRQQIFDKIEGCGIDPLQIVEENGERMFRTSEDTDETPHYQLKTSLRILRRKVGHWRLFSDNVLQFRNQLEHQGPVEIQRLAKHLAPFTQLFLTFAQ